VHRRYQRQLADLPWGTRAVHIQLTARKCVCRQPTCARRIFTERLPDLVAPSARKNYSTHCRPAGHRHRPRRSGRRSAASVAAWLAQHPTITTVCRDRSDLYADGIRRGAPQAVQVVDRLHLVHNLRQALEAVLLDHCPVLQAAAVCAAMALTLVDGPIPILSMYRGRRRNPKSTPQEEAARPPRHARWVATYEAVHALRVQGSPIATIARRLGISRPTV
jgi:hypothetical protein